MRAIADLGPPLVLGVDAGLAHMGVAVVAIHRDREEVERLVVFETEKSDKRRRVLASDDNARRLLELARCFGELWSTVHMHRVRAVCAEAQSFPRNASSAAKTAMSWAMVLTNAARFDWPVVQASPQEVKDRLCGHKAASKEDVERAVRRRYKGLGRHLRHYPGGVHEHAYDALAAVVATLSSDVVCGLRRLTV